MLSSRFRACSFLCLCASYAIASPNNYQVHALASLSSGGFDTATHILNDGTVVGSVEQDLWHHYGAAWTSSGLQTYGTSNYYDRNVLRSINSSHIATGYQLTNQGDYGFVLDLNANTQTTIAIKFPTAINESGEIVGDHTQFTSHEFVRYRDTNGNVSTLDHPSWASDDQAYDINDGGWIVGTSFDNQSMTQGWKRNRTGARQALVGLDGDPATACGTGAINNLGQICGWSSSGNSFLPVLWNPDGTCVSLGTPFGAADHGSAEATGINESGVVVGNTHYYLPGPTYYDTGWIWTADDGIQLLDPLLTDSNWRITAVTGINDLGQIVGRAVNYGETTGKEYAVVLDPQAVPEPSTMAILGGIALAGWSRQRRSRRSAS